MATPTTTALLSQIHTPKDLKQLSIEALIEVAREIRQRMVDVEGMQSGYLDRNRAVVELTLALHYLFDSPLDTFIFDIDHQTYSHKLLTRGNESSPKIERHLDFSGFVTPHESIHDSFCPGHGGTALSLALGTAASRDICEEKGFVIPIFGDAALSCGVTAEALCHIPPNLQQFIAILNDSSEVFTNPEAAKTNKERYTKYFEQYGLKYVGPLDGHDLPLLIETLSLLKKEKSPILLHLRTVKDRECDTLKTHPQLEDETFLFDKEKKTHLSCGTTFSHIFGQHLFTLGLKDPSIFVVTSERSQDSCFSTFIQKFPARCKKIQMAEGHAVTFSGALAKDPRNKVVCPIYATFLQRAFDNLFHDVCLQKFPVIFGLDHAGLSTSTGIVPHGIYDMGFLQAMPNMVICQPRDGHLLKELLESAFDWEFPVAIRYPHIKTSESALPLQRRPLGKGEMLKTGSTVALLGLGHMSLVALEVATLLQKEGLNPTVVDPIFVKPLDTELLTHLFVTHSCIITLEEHALAGGFGAAINSFAVKQEFASTQLMNFGIGDLFICQGDHPTLLKVVGLDPSSIAKAIVKKAAQSHLFKPVERS